MVQNVMSHAQFSYRIMTPYQGISTCEKLHSTVDAEILTSSIEMHKFDEPGLKNVDGC